MATFPSGYAGDGGVVNRKPTRLQNFQPQFESDIFKDAVGHFRWPKLAIVHGPSPSVIVVTKTSILSSAMIFSEP